MKLPAHVKGIRARYLERFPLWSMAPGADAEERARQWSIGFAEQVMFMHPAEGWGMKRADPTRPISKDTISQADAGRLLTWDQLTGAGTGAPSLVDDPDSKDVSDQFYEDRPEYIRPQDHLGLGGELPHVPPASPQVVVPPVVVPPAVECKAQPVDLAPVLAAIADLRADVQTIKNRPDPSWPAFPAALDGNMNLRGQITLFPRKPKE